jgi:hypothetical protein
MSVRKAVLIVILITVISALFMVILMFVNGDISFRL